ncbi:MAG: glycine--tRNA ligase subunit beta [Hyphomonadaceae bacterium]
MPQLFIEFFSEEIPARMQKRAEEDLARLMGEKLKAAGLEAKAIETFSGPRRLTLKIDDLPARTPDVREERKGPRVGAPEKAIEGFLKGVGLSSLDQAKVQSDPKGDFYLAVIEKKGAATTDVLAQAVPEIVRAFPWPKSMRSQDNDLQWVRPLHNIACVFGGAHVRVALPGVQSEPLTWGHRFHAPAAIEIADFAAYEKALRAARVVIDREERKRIILEGARAACAAKRLELVEDAGLLEEVAGLAEWPVVLMGDMDPAFLDLPGEVIRLSMRTHQKYFAVRDPKAKTLAPHFVVVANIEAKDGGAAIAAGNARVLSARLNDARFFWDQDRKLKLGDESRVEKLKQIVFHQKLGSVWEKVERVRALAKELCAVTGADPALVNEAARLMKCDLVTETVGEFPELQGQIGRQLFALEGGASSVALAIEDHYRPLGPNDRAPSDPVAVTLALADKLDTLAGFWAIGEKPTGSSDPYGLRRAALGLIRTIFGSNLQFPINPFLEKADFFLGQYARPVGAHSAFVGGDITDYGDDLLAFLADRLKVQLRDQGKRHDLVDAVFALGDDDLVRIIARVEALDAFLKTEDGKNLLAGYKRAANILRAEEKKNAELSTLLQKHEFDAAQLKEAAEKSLYDALERARPKVKSAVESERFADAMQALADLRAPVDKFFDAVLVNAPEENLRLNRLALLARMRDALHQVADFSKVEG